MNRAQRRTLERKPLFQAIVTDKDGKQIAVCPATNNRDMPEMLCQSINLMVAKGRELNWRDACVVTVKHVES